MNKIIPYTVVAVTGLLGMAALGSMINTGCQLFQNKDNRGYPARVVRELGPTENKFRNACDGWSDIQVRATDFSDILKERDDIISREGYTPGKEQWKCERKDNDPYNHELNIYPTE